jgi:heavy metal efflux system protein
VFFTSTITVTAFIPLFTMQGVEGQIFGPMARTYVYALAGALFATFTVTPVLASFMIPRKVKRGETLIVKVLRAVYTPVLTWSLGRRAVSIGAGLAFLAVGGLVATRLGSEFLPGKLLDPRFAIC